MLENKCQVVNEKEYVPHTKPPFKIAKRPPNPLNKFIKETKNSYQITSTDLRYIYRNIIFAKSFGELRELMEDDEKRDSYPVIVIAIIAGVLGDIARGNVINLTRMLQFIFPKIDELYDPDLNKSIGSAGSAGYDDLVNLEDRLRKLEGDDALMIVDKLIAIEDKTNV